MPFTSKFGHNFRLDSIGELMDTLIFSWEKKFGHGSSPGSGNLSSGFLSTSKFGHSFRPESVEEVLNTGVLYWTNKMGMAHPLGQIFPPLECPPLRNLVIAYALSLWDRRWIL